MNDFTLEDIEYYLQENLDLLGYNGRKRYILDRRNYLMHILLCKFKLKEYEIADVLNIKRSAVHFSKYHAYHWRNDPDFKLNIEHIRKRFIFSARKPKVKGVEDDFTRVGMKLDKDETLKLQAFSKAHGCYTLGEAMKKMIRIY